MKDLGPLFTIITILAVILLIVLHGGTNGAASDMSMAHLPSWTYWLIAPLTTFTYIIIYSQIDDNKHTNAVMVAAFFFSMLAFSAVTGTYYTMHANAELSVFVKTMAVSTILGVIIVSASIGPGNAVLYAYISTVLFACLLINDFRFIEHPTRMQYVIAKEDFPMTYNFRPLILTASYSVACFIASSIISFIVYGLRIALLRLEKRIVRILRTRFP